MKTQETTSKHEIPPRIKKALVPGESLFWSDRPPYNGAWVANRRMKLRGRELPLVRKSSKDIKVVAAWREMQRKQDARGLSEQSHQTLSAWFDYLKQNDWPSRLKFVTIESKSQRWNKHIKPYLGELQLSEVDKMTVRQWLVELDEKKTDEGKKAVGLPTITECRRDLHAMFAAAVDIYEILDRNPVAKIKTKEPEKRTKAIISAKVARAALNKGLELAVDDAIVPVGKLPRWIVGMAAVGFMAGLRRGEIQALAHEQLDRERMVIKVTQAIHREEAGKLAYGLPKAGKTREVPLIPALLEIIDATTAGSTGLLWSTEWEKKKKIGPRSIQAGRPKPSTAILRWWKAFVTLTDLPEGMVFRDTRSTFASWLNELGLGPKTVIEIMGHSTIKVTNDRYIDVTNQAMAEARNRIQGLTASLSADS